MHQTWTRSGLRQVFNVLTFGLAVFLPLNFCAGSALRSSAFGSIAGYEQVVYPLPAQDLLRVTASPSMILVREGYYEHPFRSGSTFRMIFKLSSVYDFVPVTTVAHDYPRGRYILDWRAFTNRGAVCVLLTRNLSGVTAFRGRTVWADRSVHDLMNQANVGTIASSNQPTMIRADFSCDQTVYPGDQVAANVTFFARGPGGWRTVRDTFNRVAQASR